MPIIIVEMDAKTVREWKADFDSHNRFVDNERRNATPQERFRDLKAIWAQARYLHFFHAKPVDMELVERWQRLREAYRKAHA